MNQVYKMEKDNASIIDDEIQKSLLQLWQNSHVIVGLVYDEKSEQVKESGYLPASKIKTPLIKKATCCSNPQYVLTGLGWSFCINCGARQ